ncbi:MAG: hypothetical protein JWP96_334 [Polaromonas sp.]|nr:hypothetical protein [Polaromonas sp.]
MNKYAGKRMAALMALAGAAALAGCAGMKSTDPLALPLYQCEQGMQFTVRFVNDTAVLKGARGDDVLLREAGGQGAQTVYSNPRLRAEFGLGAGGREAVLRYLQQPVVARCASD